MLIYLREASPWLRFIGILSFIGCGFTALMGLLTLLVSGFIDFADLSLALPGLSNWGGPVMGAVYLGGAALLIFSGRFTYNFGAKIGHFLRSGAAADLELAFKNNKSLWKLNGIMAIVYLALVPALIVIVAVAAVYSSALR
jgi:hypothetical protein